MNHPNDTQETNPSVHTAKDVVPGRLVLAVSITAVVVSVVSVWFSSKLLDATTAELGRPPDDVREVSIEAPREIGLVDQTLIGSDRHGLRTQDEQRRSLDGYGWADEEHGRVRIPIERAMELYLAREGAR